MFRVAHLPVVRPEPNAQEFIDIIMGRSQSTRTPLVEYIVDEVVMRPVMEHLLKRSWVVAKDRESLTAYLDNFIAFWYHLGYDFVRIEIGLPFAENRLITADAAPGSNKDRSWANEHQGTIQSWEDFEKYPWPKLSDLDFFPLEYINEHMPEGMGLMSCHGGGIFEHLSFIMSIEGLCMAVYEQPDLVQALVNRLGKLLEDFYRRLFQLDRLIAVFQGDDMGFRTGTLIGPDMLRSYCLPWHQRLAKLVHDQDLPFFLHSCGNLHLIMEDLIEIVGIDAKHSFEDAIIPVQEFQARYGHRIGVLGGIDINLLSAGTSWEVREHTRDLIETCGSRGRYAVGSGNSIPSYVPVENYLAMVDEANACARRRVLL
ncbi:MAG: hypothetical protein HY706_00370 [Candidatus Hydrogenedentes bacterium]|nr:hypothetical protein [Candidatus Hydrogenedentota bacterium]